MYLAAQGIAVVCAMSYAAATISARFGMKQMKARWEDYNVVTWGEILVVEVVPDGVTSV